MGETRAQSGTMWSMRHPDNKGYYRILGIAPEGSQIGIKKAFRRRSKELHPDYNKRLGAAEQFAALNEAYRVLSDPEARARYDMQTLEAVTPEGGGDGEPVACQRCRKVSAQPRYVIYRRVIGAFTRVAVDSVHGVWCPRCARDMAVSATMFTWALGWWGLPSGPVMSVRAIWKNALGGSMPKQANARLLGYQARAFTAAGKTELARALAAEALSIDPEHRDREWLIQARDGGDGPVPTLKRSWGLDPLSALVQLAPAGLLVAVLVMLGPWGPMADPTAGRGVPGPAAQVAPGARTAHVSEDGASLHDGPGLGQPVLTQLPPFETVMVTGGPVNGGWVPVTVGGVRGYLRMDQVAEGPGGAALLAWCTAHRGERPASGRLSAAGGGPHTINTENRLGRDALIKLLQPDGGTALTFYLRAGERLRLDGVPEGTLRAVYATGADYSNGCGTFLSDLSVHAFTEPLRFTATVEGGGLYAATVSLTLVADDPAQTPIPPEVFSGG
ncbi:MAG: DnaJ domain-containing protein [Leptospirillia bacterium]